MNKKYLYEKVLICKLNFIESRAHIINKPILLPCGCSNCLKCIQNADYKTYNVDTKQFNCLNQECGESYCINDILKLPSNAYLHELFMGNIKYIANDVLHRYLFTAENISKSMALENRLNAINDYLQYTEDQTEIRIESIKMELEEVSKRVLQYQLKHYQKALNLKKLEKNRCNRIILEKMLQQAYKYKIKWNSALDISVSKICKDTCSEISIKDICSYSKVLKYNRVVSREQIEINSKCIRKMIKLRRDIETEDEVLATDEEENSLILVNVNEHNFKKFVLYDTNRGLPIQKAQNLCINSLNQIYLHSHATNAMYMLDSQFNLIMSQQLNQNEFGGYINCIANDSDYPYDIYIIDRYFNKLILYNIHTNLKLNEINLQRPCNIALYKEHVFVTSLTDYDYAEYSLRKLKHTTKGCNSIYVIHKRNFSIVRMIKFSNWLQPLGLFIDNDGNIWTLAFKLDENFCRSKFRYLFIINVYDEIIKEIYIKHITEFYDFTVVNKDTLVFCFGFRSKGLMMIKIDQ